MMKYSYATYFRNVIFFLRFVIAMEIVIVTLDINPLSVIIQV